MLFVDNEREILAESNPKKECSHYLRHPVVKRGERRKEERK